MNSTQQKLADRSITPRQVVFDVMKVIRVDYSKNMSVEDTSDKIIFWHLGLRDISDEAVSCGLVQLLKNPSEFPPNCGKFRDMCKLPKKIRYPKKIEQHFTEADLNARSRFFDKLKDIGW